MSDTEEVVGFTTGSAGFPLAQFKHLTQVKKEAKLYIGKVYCKPQSSPFYVLLSTDPKTQSLTHKTIMEKYKQNWQVIENSKLPFSIKEVFFQAMQSAVLVLLSKKEKAIYDLLLERGSVIKKKEAQEYKGSFTTFFQEVERGKRKVTAKEGWFLSELQDFFDNEGEGPVTDLPAMFSPPQQPTITPTNTETTEGSTGSTNTASTEENTGTNTSTEAPSSSTSFTSVTSSPPIFESATPHNIQEDQITPTTPPTSHTSLTPTTPTTPSTPSVLTNQKKNSSPLSANGDPFAALAKFLSKRGPSITLPEECESTAKLTPAPTTTQKKRSRKNTAPKSGAAEHKDDNDKSSAEEEKAQTKKKGRRNFKEFVAEVKAKKGAKNTKKSSDIETPAETPTETPPETPAQALISTDKEISAGTTAPEKSKSPSNKTPTKSSEVVELSEYEFESDDDFSDYSPPQVSSSSEEVSEDGDEDETRESSEGNEDKFKDKKPSKNNEKSNNNKKPDTKGKAADCESTTAELKHTDDKPKPTDPELTDNKQKPDEQKPNERKSTEPKSTNTDKKNTGNDDDPMNDAENHIVMESIWESMIEMAKKDGRTFKVKKEQFYEACRNDKVLNMEDEEFMKVYKVKAATGTTCGECVGCKLERKCFPETREYHEFQLAEAVNKVKRYRRSRLLIKFPHLNKRRGVKKEPKKRKGKQVSPKKDKRESSEEEEPKKRKGKQASHKKESDEEDSTPPRKKAKQIARKRATIPKKEEENSNESDNPIASSSTTKPSQTSTQKTARQKTAVRPKTLSIIETLTLIEKIKNHEIISMDEYSLEELNLFFEEQSNVLWKNSYCTLQLSSEVILTLRAKLDNFLKLLSKYNIQLEAENMEVVGIGKLKFLELMLKGVSDEDYEEHDEHSYHNIEQLLQAHAGYKLPSDKTAAEDLQDRLYKVFQKTKKANEKYKLDPYCRDASFFTEGDHIAVQNGYYDLVHYIFNNVPRPINPNDEDNLLYGLESYVSGYNEPWFYVFSLLSMFGLHIEDLGGAFAANLYTCLGNPLKCSKLWTIIPGEVVNDKVNYDKLIKFVDESGSKKHNAKGGDTLTFDKSRYYTDIPDKLNSVEIEQNPNTILLLFNVAHQGATMGGFSIAWNFGLPALLQSYKSYQVSRRDALKKEESYLPTCCNETEGYPLLLVLWSALLRASKQRHLQDLLDFFKSLWDETNVFDMNLDLRFLHDTKRQGSKVTTSTQYCCGCGEFCLFSLITFQGYIKERKYDPEEKDDTAPKSKEEEKNRTYLRERTAYDPDDEDNTAKVVCLKCYKDAQHNVKLRARLDNVWTGPYEEEEQETKTDEEIRATSMRMVACPFFLPGTINMIFESTRQKIAKNELDKKLSVHSKLEKI